MLDFSTARRASGTNPRRDEHLKCQTADRLPSRAATFPVLVRRRWDLHYPGRKDGVNIAGATGSGYLIASFQNKRAGGHSVVIAHATRGATSQSAQISATPAVDVRGGMILVSGCTLPACPELGAVPVHTSEPPHSLIRAGAARADSRIGMIHGYPPARMQGGLSRARDRRERFHDHSSAAMDEIGSTVAHVKMVPLQRQVAVRGGAGNAQFVGRMVHITPYEFAILEGKNPIALR